MQESTAGLDILAGAIGFEGAKIEALSSDDLLGKPEALFRLFPNGAVIPRVSMGILVVWSMAPLSSLMTDGCNTVLALALSLDSMYLAEPYLSPASWANSRP